ncbi:phage minor head protein [Actibacterium lipolyticum]|uniref:Phage Mu protein F like protein n=1 Tax=Actibacterium lipolyticum TaxID=1524263 RepID=A0A238JQE4_9RHOB|nr:phage minor head protein [Actibacterium lipolyticum]SMX31976.1 Phage Mu protein F like protein [Actibacterium lipolyticum]
MALDTPFVRFVRSGGKSEFTVSLDRLNRAPERKDASFNLAPYLQRFLELLEDADAGNAAFLSESLGDADGYNSGPLKQRIFDEFEARLTVTQAVYEREGHDRAGILSLIEVDIQANEAWLLRRFENELNEARQRAAGVTHYIWRSADDSKVRSSHAERDDRVFPWDHGFPDGLPGEAHNCRCYAEPAILNGQTILTGRPVSPDLADRISDAQGRGLARAGEDALVSTVTGIYDVLRFSYLGYRRLFGVITDEEEQERLTARQNILDALERLAELDRETAEQIAEEAASYFEAQHAELRLLDLEYRLGLTSEEALLRAYEDVAYLDASVLLGGTAFTAGAAKLGINLTRLRPTAALNALRAGRNRFDDMINTRRREVDTLVASRFADLEAQGHGPQRHEGAVTRQMLEDRVLRGIDPMTGTTTDGVTGGTHNTVRTATRITNEADFVAAEAQIRRSPDYRAARDEAMSRLGLRTRTTFEVSLPIEDVLGRDFHNAVEGIRRLGSVKNPTGIQTVDFGSGTVTAVYELLHTGEPSLVTLFPTGVR